MDHDDSRHDTAHEPRPAPPAGAVGRARPETVAHVPPLDMDGVRTVQVGTALWAVALLALLPFSGWLAETGRTWWLWTCCAGLGLGLLGIDHCRRRRDAAAEEARLSVLSTGGRRRR